MKNLFKLRNFDGHLDNGYIPPTLTDSELSSAMAVSNTLYDHNRGITHAFIHTNKGSDDDKVRLVCDVELAMSSSLDVRTVVSPEMQQRLRLGLTNQPKTGSPGLSDDQLVSSMPANFGLERDESVNLLRHELRSLDRSISVAASSTPSVDPPTTPSVDPPSTES